MIEKPQSVLALPPSDKVDGCHRERVAIIYVRQSTIQQVERHQEPTRPRLQWGFAYAIRLARSRANCNTVPALALRCPARKALRLLPLVPPRQHGAGTISAQARLARCDGSPKAAFVA
jgi:hypothetical protein